MSGRIGLEGLKGINYDSKADREWLVRQRRAGIVTNDWSERDIQNLYRNQQFIDKYGIDRFNAMINDPKGRDALYRSDIVTQAFEDNFSSLVEPGEAAQPGTLNINGYSYDPNKGLGADYFKYRSMGVDAMQELLESEYKTPSEMKAFQEEKERKRKAGTLALGEVSMRGAPSTALAALGAFQSAQGTGDVIEDFLDAGKNQKILDRIWEEDLEKKRKVLSPAVRDVKNTVIFELTDDEVNEAFAKAINPKEGGVPYIYSAYFGEDGLSKRSETEGISREDKREFLAKKLVYDNYLGESAGYDALNNEAIAYISEHQPWYNYTTKLSKDIGISALSYVSDQYNGVRRLSLLGQEANVYMTNDGRVVPTKDVHTELDDNGNLVATYEENGQLIPVHSQTLSLIALDDLGKDEDGEDLPWFKNAQFWTNAEQFGTMDKEEQARFKDLGYSPYKVVYEPGDEGDLFYESVKMLSFGLADRAVDLLPMGASLSGAKLAAYAGRHAGMLARAGEYAGKTLALSGNLAHKAQPITAALGIGNAYGRGAFGGNYAENLYSLEESVLNQAQYEVEELYNNNPAYRYYFDKAINKRIEEIERTTPDVGVDTYGRAINTEAREAMIRKQATQDVFADAINNWVNNFKNSETYGNAVENAVENASTGALVTAATTGLKYTAINYGWRKFLFKTPGELAKSQTRGVAEGVTEELTKTGKKRLAFRSKFDLATAAGRRREVVRTIGAQWWGGFWTNATDEMQSGGGTGISSSRTAQFLSGMYDSPAYEIEYDLGNDVGAFTSGAIQALGKETTLNAGLAGGFGSIGTAAPNFFNIAALTSKKTRGEAKALLKNKKYEELANMFLSNGVLNNYYAKRQAQENTKITMAHINTILDESNDLKSLHDVLALDLASIDSTDLGDEKDSGHIMAMLRAVAIVNQFRAIQEGEGQLPIAMRSSIIEEAMNAIEELSDLSKLSEDRQKHYLELYYKENQGTPKSEENHKKALQELQERALVLQEATTTYSELYGKLKQIEKDSDVKLSSVAKNKMLARLTFDVYAKQAIENLEKEITGRSAPTESNHTLSSQGNLIHQNNHLRALSSVLRETESFLEEAKKAVEEARKALQLYNEKNPESTTDTEAVKDEKRKSLREALENAQIQVDYLTALRTSIDSEVTGSTAQNRLFSAYEIINTLNPIDRARMLAPDNYENYSNTQKAEIEKAKAELSTKDPSLLKKVQTLASLYLQHQSNKKTLGLMLQHPEVASHQLDAEVQKAQLAAGETSAIRIAMDVAEGVKKIRKKGKSLKMPASEVNKQIYSQLRKLSPTILKYIRDLIQDGEISFRGVKRILKDAIEWSEIVSDISSIEDKIVASLGETAAKGFRTSLDNLLSNLELKSKQDILDEIGRLIESSAVTENDKSPFIDLLNELEQVYNQRASTVTTTKEQRIENRKQQEERRKQEEERRKEAERIAEEEAKARAEEEKQAKEIEEAEEAEEIDNEAHVDDADKQAAIDDAIDVDLDDADGKHTEEKKEGKQEEEKKDKEKKKDKKQEEPKEAEAAKSPEAEPTQKESPSIEEQVLEAKEGGTAAEIIPTQEENTMERANDSKTTSGVLLGNVVYGYDVKAARRGKQVSRKDPPNTNNRYFAWLEAAGIKLQEIIDNELSAIRDLDVKVHPLYVRNEKNEAYDDAMKEFVFLAVEYTPEAARIHKDERGGVITSNGKQYLIIGTAGFQRGNIAQQSSLQKLIHAGQFTWFQEHPSERFFVDTSKHTKIQRIFPGEKVKQLEGDTEVKTRSISEVLADPKRNPRGLTMKDLKWGIQYGMRMATVRVSERNSIYYPKDAESNVGSVFLLLEGSDGVYFPIYIKPTRYSEIKDGSLKSRIDKLFRDFTSSDYNVRAEAWNKLRHLVSCDSKGNWILFGNATHNTVTVQKEGKQGVQYDLNDPNVDINALIQELKDVDFRINITVSALSNETSLAELDEAGALTTDIALLGTINSDYRIYDIDDNGEPSLEIEAHEPNRTPENSSDLAKAQQKLNSEMIGKTTYRKNTDGYWETETGELVTDPKLIEQLNNRNLIRTRELTPDFTIGNDEIFIINADRNNPHVLVRRGKSVTTMSKEGALKTIDKHNAEAVKKTKEKRAKQKLADLEKDNLPIDESSEIEGIIEKPTPKAEKTKEKSIDDLLLELQEGHVSPPFVSDTSGFRALTLAEWDTVRAFIKNIFDSNSHPSMDSILRVLGLAVSNLKVPENTIKFIEELLKAHSKKEVRGIDGIVASALMPRITEITSEVTYLEDTILKELPTLEELSIKDGTTIRLLDEVEMGKLRNAVIKTLTENPFVSTEDLISAIKQSSPKIVIPEKVVQLIDKIIKLHSYHADKIDIKRNIKDVLFTRPNGQGPKYKYMNTPKATATKSTSQKKTYTNFDDVLHITSAFEGFSRLTGSNNGNTWYSQKTQDVGEPGKKEGWYEKNGILYFYKPLKGRQGDNVTVWVNTLITEKGKKELSDYFKTVNELNNEVKSRMLEIINNNLLEPPSSSSEAPISSQQESQKPIAESKPINTADSVQSLERKSLAELQSKTTPTTVEGLIRDKTLGAGIRQFLKEKFGNALPKKMSDIKKFLEAKGINVENITDVELWKKEIEECK